MATEIAESKSTPLSKANIGLKMKCFDFYSTLPFCAVHHSQSSVFDKNIGVERTSYDKSSFRP